MCEDPIVLPSGSLDIVLFDITTGAIILVAYFDMCVLSPESAIARMLSLGGLGGV